MNRKFIFIILLLFIVTSSGVFLSSITSNNDTKIYYNYDIGDNNIDKDEINDEFELRTSKTGIVETYTISEADSCALNSDPYENYGDLSIMLNGFGLESYVRFNFSDKPFYYTNVSVSLYFEFTEPQIENNYPIYLIEEYWGEDTITWSNKPDKGPQIDTLTVDTDGIYHINVTEYIEGKNNISLCIGDGSDTRDTICYTKEHIFAGNERPRLNWYYEGELGIFVSKPTSGASLNEGQHEITWDSIGASNDVVVKLYNDSIYVCNITDKTLNDGYLLWNISCGTEFSGDKYQIKIFDIADPLINGTSDYFEISTQSCPRYIAPNGDDDDGDDEDKYLLPLTIIVVCSTIGIGVSVIIFLLKKGILRPSKSVSR